MSGAEAIAVILSGAVPLVVALAGLLWWAYKRGEASGAERARREAVERSQAEDKAKIAALERELAEIRAGMTLGQQKRKRALQLPE